VFVAARQQDKYRMIDNIASTHQT